MSLSKGYRIYDEDRNLVCEGSSRQCSAIIGIPASTIRHWGLVHQNEDAPYWVEVIEPDGEKIVTKDVNSAAKRWDDFCEPLRKKYGIAVYKEDNK
jgi:hypothetical protein